MQAAFATVLGVIVGILVLAGALLILGFLSIGVLAPIGAAVSSMANRRRRRIHVQKPAPVGIGRPVPHH